MVNRKDAAHLDLREAPPLSPEVRLVQASLPLVEKTPEEGSHEKSTEAVVLGATRSTAERIGDEISLPVDNRLPSLANAFEDAMGATAAEAARARRGDYYNDSGPRPKHS